MRRAASVRLAGPATLLTWAALLAACQTAGESPPNAAADPEPARPAAARTGGGPIAGSPVRGASRARPAAAAAVPAPSAAALPAPAPAPAPAPEPAAAPDPQPLPPAPPVPHIYMALQPGGAGGQVSAVFAIDAARDNTPSDDPAVRLTPEAGLCNPHEMRGYDFAPEDAARPVVSEAEQEAGLTPQDLPAFMAVSVTEKMLSLGLADEREETRALNVCTRKLWERLVAAGK